MTTEPRRRWGALRGILGGLLGLATEALAVGAGVAMALALAALVLWVA